MQRYIVFNGLVLPGSVSTARSRCGKLKCACKGKPPHLHGIYHRWTGFVGGKRTTKTLSREMALECERRVQNFRRLQREIAKLVRESLTNAPWIAKSKKPRTGRKR